MDPLTDHASTLPAWAVLLLGLMSLIGTVVTALIAARINRGVSGVRTVAEETRHQVTVNHHSSTTPTVLDRIDDLSQELRATTRRVADVEGKLTEHLAESRTVLQLLAGAPLRQLDRLDDPPD